MVLPRVRANDLHFGTLAFILTHCNHSCVAVHITWQLSMELATRQLSSAY